MQNKLVLTAITDPVLLPEVQHIVATTGQNSIDTTDPREIARHAARSDIILCDSETAPFVASLSPTQRRFLVVGSHEEPDWQLAMRLRAEQVVLLPDEANVLLQAIGREDAAASGTARAPVIAVLGVQGGVGTSTFACALAAALPDAVLLDAAANSGGLDLVLGCEHTAGIRLNDIPSDGGDLRGTDLFEALPRSAQGIRVLAQARSAENDCSLHQMRRLVSTFRGHYPVVLDAGTKQELTEDADLTVLILGAEVRAAAVLASRTLPQTARCGVLRHRQWSSMTAAEITTLTGLEITAEIPTIRGFAKQVELSGMPEKLPRALSKASAAVLTELPE